LAQARNNELAAILDYTRSVVDFETVQQAPIAGTSVATAATATSANVATGLAGATSVATQSQTIR
jgi:hypothetical protein